MKAERIYNELNRYIENLEEDQKQNMKAFIKEGVFPSWYVSENMKIVFDLFMEAKNELENQKARANGTSGIKKAAEKITKLAEKNGRRGWNKAIQTEAGKYIFIDGYRAIETTEHFDYEVEKEENEKITKLFRGVEEDNTRNETEEMPTVAFLNEWIRSEKKRQARAKQVYYDFGEEKPAFNAEYLRDILLAVGNNPVMKYGTPYQVVLISGDNCRALLCPVSKKAMTNQKESA